MANKRASPPTFPFTASLLISHFSLVLYLTEKCLFVGRNVMTQVSQWKINKMFLSVFLLFLSDLQARLQPVTWHLLCPRGMQVRWAWVFDSFIYKLNGTNGTVLMMYCYLVGKDCISLCLGPSYHCICSRKVVSSLLRPVVKLNVCRTKEWWISDAKCSHLHLS